MGRASPQRIFGQGFTLKRIAAKIILVHEPCVYSLLRSCHPSFARSCVGAAPCVPPAPCPAFWRGADELPPRGTLAVRQSWYGAYGMLEDSQSYELT